MEDSVPYFDFQRDTACGKNKCMGLNIIYVYDVGVLTVLARHGCRRFYPVPTQVVVSLLPDELHDVGTILKILELVLHGTQTIVRTK